MSPQEQMHRGMHAVSILLELLLKLWWYELKAADTHISWVVRSQSSDKLHESNLTDETTLRLHAGIFRILFLENVAHCAGSNLIIERRLRLRHLVILHLLAAGCIEIHLPNLLPPIVATEALLCWPIGLVYVVNKFNAVRLWSSSNPLFYLKD